MTNILIPTDFSANSWNAIEYALSLYRNHHIAFYLLHVQNESDSDSSGYNSDTVVTQAAATVSKSLFKSFLKKIEQIGLKKNHRVFTILEHGSLVEIIRKQVQDKRIDLIVMGTKGASSAKNMEISPNTLEVISKVQCNTLIIPQKAAYKGLNQIALTTDHSIFYTTVILESLAAISRQNNADLHVLYLSKSETALSSEQLQNREILQEYFSLDTHFFHTLTNKNLESALQEFVENQPVELLVMVAKNIHLFQQLLYKSVSKKVAYHNFLPFFIIHE